MNANVIHCPHHAAAAIALHPSGVAQCVECHPELKNILVEVKPDAAPAPVDREKLTGVGRSDLEGMYRGAKARIEELLEKLSQRDQMLCELIAENRTLLDNLTATQNRCNELLAAYRASKFIGGTLDGDDVIAMSNGLCELGAAIVRARMKHPEGCTVRALVEEVGEAARAVRCENEDRVRAELLDAAVVAMRLWFGEWDRLREPKL